MAKKPTMPRMISPGMKPVSGNITTGSFQTATIGKPRPKPVAAPTRANGGVRSSPLKPVGKLRPRTTVTVAHSMPTKPFKETGSMIYRGGPKPPKGRSQAGRSGQRPA